MRLLYEETPEGVCLLRCYGLDGILEIPEEIHGRPVTELAGYIFSDTVRNREQPPEVYEGEPELCGEQLEELTLPSHIKKIGPYAFYNCHKFRKLVCQGSILDWGAGAFTGCSALCKLDIRIEEGKKSCFAEILSELRQTLEVNYLGPRGEMRTRLIFPEFYEESVENTPARIVMREMHGCGHMYRYCFDQGSFSFKEYDRLFPHVKVQEQPETAACLAVYRLYWPWALSEKAGADYRDFVKEYAGEASKELLRRGDNEALVWLAGQLFMGEGQVEAMVREAVKAGEVEVSACLMDIKYRRFGQKSRAARTFEL